jgi:hypothetical protein
MHHIFADLLPNFMLLFCKTADQKLRQDLMQHKVYVAANLCKQDYKLLPLYRPNQN